MQNQLHDEISRLLSTLEQAEQAEREATYPLAGEGAQGQQPPPPRGPQVLHIYLLDESAEDEEQEAWDEPRAKMPIIESSLAAASEQQQETQQPAMSPSSPFAATHSSRPSRRRRRSSLLLLGAGMLGLLSAIGLGLWWSLLPLLAPTATITLVPSAVPISTTASVQLVSDEGSANATRPQIAGRPLASLTLSQSHTIPTTGLGHQEARAAAGRITFYNAAPSVRVIAAGTLLTGADGMQVVTEQEAVLPPAVYPTFGQASVWAEAASSGPAGNIRAGDIYGPCCRLNVSAVNGPFVGGQDARSYRVVSPQDLSSVVSSLEASLQQSAQAAFETQVQQPTETLLTPVPCTATITPDHRVGEEASQVRVLLSETCEGETYHTYDLQVLMTPLVLAAATKQLGAGYALVGEVQVRILHSSPSGLPAGLLTLEVKGTGTWVSQFSQEHLQSLARMLAGKSQGEATRLLLGLPEVSTVLFSRSSGADPATLPADPARIHLLVVSYGGNDYPAGNRKEQYTHATG